MLLGSAEVSRDTVKLECPKACGSAFDKALTNAGHYVELCGNMAHYHCQSMTSSRHFSNRQSVAAAFAKTKEVPNVNTFCRYSDSVRTDSILPG